MIPFNEARVARLRSEMEDHLRNHAACTRPNCEGATQEGIDTIVGRLVSGIEEAEARAQADGVLSNWSPPETP